MKKLLIPLAAALTFAAFAQEVVAPATAPQEADELEEEEGVPLLWGFGNYGFYSGYQLYGSLVNPEPTLQGYVEVNANLAFDDVNLGYVGLGLWSNTDLTDRRRDSYGKAFNEWDPNVHYGFTYWFDDEKSWGLDYRTSVVWYYYPHRRHHKMNGSTATTMDWIHSFALKNPYIEPFLDWVHEYHENNADLLQFGLRKTINAGERFSVTPSLTFVYRDHRYNWCFPTAGFTEFHGSGIATGKLMVDANYKITENFGIFAKVAYCSILDGDLRRAADNGHGADYGKYKDFAWGAVGVSFCF